MRPSIFRMRSNSCPRPSGTLALGDAAAFKGRSRTFAGADAIDLSARGSPASPIPDRPGILTVSDSAARIAELSFEGDYTTSSFTFASDGHGGDRILYR